MKATYVSVWDDSLVCCSECSFNPATKEVTDIETADNADEADFADSLTDEYVELADGTQLRSEDGVSFDY